MTADEHLSQIAEQAANVSFLRTRVTDGSRNIPALDSGQHGGQQQFAESRGAVGEVFDMAFRAYHVADFQPAQQRGGVGDAQDGAPGMVVHHRVGGPQDLRRQAEIAVDDSNQSLRIAAVEIEGPDQHFVGVIREGRHASATGDLLHAEIELFVFGKTFVELEGVTRTPPPLGHFGRVGKKLREGTGGWGLGAGNFGARPGSNKQMSTQLAGNSKKRALQVVAWAFVALVIAGVVFEHIGQRYDRRRYPQIGKSVDIGGRTLNIFCSGEGAPAVIFETHGHMAGYSWNAVQSEVAKFKRACWYDRANYGWSDPGPMLRTYKSVASDLHALLHATGLSPPYVLVGASEAALQIRVFNGLYPREVGGVVMVDATDVDGPPIAVPESMKGGWAKHFGSIAPRVRGGACVIFPAVAQVGLLRLVELFQRPRGTSAFGLAPEQQAELDFLSDNPTAQRGGEACTRAEGAVEVHAAGDFGDRPLMLLASREFLTAGASGEETVLANWNKLQIEQVQPGLAKLSSRGRLVVLDNVTAGAIVGAVRDVVGAVASQ
jgi:hypothetical protein